MAQQQEPDAEGNHYVTCRDGTSIRCRLLLGGPAGDGRLDPKARTAICLHGIGEDLSFWEEGVFRTEDLPENFSGERSSGSFVSPQLNLVRIRGNAVNGRNWARTRQ